jgi:hypothetical protein
MERARLIDRAPHDPLMVRQVHHEGDGEIADLPGLILSLSKDEAPLLSGRS